MERTWTEVGEHYSKGANRKKIERYIEALEWQPVPCTVGMMPGMAIKEAVKEFRIPKVSHIAISHEMAPLGFYGIRGHYANGTGQVYLVDDGISLTPVCSEIERAKEDRDNEGTSSVGVQIQDHG